MLRNTISALDRLVPHKRRDRPDSHIYSLFSDYPCTVVLRISRLSTKKRERYLHAYIYCGENYAYEETGDREETVKLLSGLKWKGVGLKKIKKEIKNESILWK